MVFPSGMTGMDIWVDGEKKQLTSGQLEVTAGARLLSFFIPTEKLKTMLTTPFKFSVGSQKDCTLKSWYQYGLQQFAGYVDYEKNINIEKAGSGISLDLGQVKYMAEVFVNGKSVGARLWPPYRFDLSGELKSGDNMIKVRIGSLVIGDFWIKEDLGKLRTWGWEGLPGFDQFDAGLFGPVKLLVKK
jgi:hypothetical protein